MVKIVFLLDTSASMNQRADYGKNRLSLFDIAKEAVEKFIILRQRNEDSRRDTYILLTSEEYPHNIKTHWKDDVVPIINELKHLQCTSLKSLSNALKQTFTLLNLNRMQLGIDRYGRGYYPHYLDPTIILFITNGEHSSPALQQYDNLEKISLSSVPGFELTQQPFRWDQRLFVLSLKLSGDNFNMYKIITIDSSLKSFCEKTGGRWYCVISQQTLMCSLESVMRKIKNGVVVHFQKYVPKQIISTTYNNESNSPFNEKWYSCKNLLLISKPIRDYHSVGFWPIPEVFWFDITVSSLPARSAHPTIKFVCTDPDETVFVIGNFPIDQYELEPSPLTKYILEQRNLRLCWQVFVVNSQPNSEIGYTFGYIKVSEDLKSVYLHLTAYNYPVLFPLLSQFINDRNLTMVDWMKNFKSYMQTIPAYYTRPLCKALVHFGLTESIVYEFIPNTSGLSSSIDIHLKTLGNKSRKEFNQIYNSVFNNINSKELYKSSRKVDDFRNPYNILRTKLLDQLQRMRTNFLQPQVKHELPKASPLGIIDFKCEDQKDIFDLKNNNSNYNAMYKGRERGPLPRDFSYHKDLSTHSYLQSPVMESKNPLDSLDSKEQLLVNNETAEFFTFQCSKLININKLNKLKKQKSLSDQKSATDIKRILFTDIRKPGKNHQDFFEHLLLIRKFNADTVENILQDVFKEVLRFKRARLANKIFIFLQNRSLKLKK